MAGLQDIAGDDRLREQRRTLVINHPVLRGLERVELVHDDEDRHTIELHFLPSAVTEKSALPPGLKAADVTLRASAPDAPTHYAEALRRVDQTVLRAIFAKDAFPANDATGGGLVLELRELASLDPLSRTARLARSAATVIGQPRQIEPNPTSDGDVDYLSKDYDGYRQLMLDRMAASVPQWRERHTADIGITIIETLAYTADQLSYFQDAVATETYLSTARRRVSAKRHARLLDYRAHDGCAARAFVQLQVNAPCTIKKHLPILCSTASEARNGVIRATGLDARGANDQPTFETLADANLWPGYESMPLYSWAAKHYTLPAGATCAMLQGHFEHLSRGDVLIFAAVRDAMTGRASSNLSHRQAVRLRRPPRPLHDPLTKTALTEIVWYPEDALRFDLPVCAVVGEAQLRGLSACLGNIVPVDAGWTFAEPNPRTPQHNPLKGGADDQGGCFTMALDRSDLIFAAPYDDRLARASPAAQFANPKPEDSKAEITLDDVDGPTHGGPWRPVQDLLAAGRFDRQFVVETEDDGTTTLRFGDGRNGRQPSVGNRFRAAYRVGRMDLNVGAGTLVSWAPRDVNDEAITAVFNPMPARGGVQRETASEIRLRAPGGFRQQKRCVIADDYADAAKEHPLVADATASTQWMGSRSLIVVRIRPVAGGDADADLLSQVSALLEQRRMIDARVDVRSATFAPLEITLNLDVAPPYTPAEARRNVAARIRGLLAAPIMGFGQDVRLGPLLAAALHEPGVVDARAIAFCRRGDQRFSVAPTDRIAIEPFEIAQIDDVVTAAGRGLLRIEARPTP